MKKLKLLFKIIISLTVVALIFEFILFFSLKNSSNFNIVNSKKLIVKIFNLQISKKDNVEITKNFSAFHPFVGWVHPPNSSILIKGKCHNDAIIKTDILGNSQVSKYFMNPDFNLVLTGGSTVFGVGSSDNNNTIASLVQKEFTNNNKKINVYNLGIRGVQSFQEFQRLYEFLTLHDKKIDLVISFSGRNDANFASQNSDVKYSLAPKYSHDLSNEINLLFDHKIYVNNIIYIKNVLVDNFYTLDFLYQVIKKITLRQSAKNLKNNKIIIKSNINKKTQITANNYDLMFNVSKLFDADYKMILQPTIYTKKNITQYEKNCAKISWNDNYRDFERSFYESLFKELKDKEYFYDFRSIFDKTNKSIFVDIIHSNNLGVKIIAKNIYKIIVESYNF